MKWNGRSAGMDWSLAFKILRDCFRWDRVNYPRAEVLTVAHDTDRSLLHEGRWYSPLVDTLEDDLRARGVRCVSVARIISRIKGDLAYGKALSPEGAFARALVVKRLIGLLRRGGAYPYSQMEERIWGRILDATGVRRVVAIQPSRELCVACRKRGVWVADIQHGVIGESHPWYGETYRAHEPAEYLPHAFLCWDQGSLEVIDRWVAAKGVETIVTGNRWVARFIRPRAHDGLVGAMLEKFRAGYANPRGKPTLLVALSWGDVTIPNGFMVDALRDVIRQTQGQYHWLVRLHPNQLNGFATHEAGRFRRYFEENLQGYVEWELATRSPLPLVLSHVDMVISWNSSVSIEAAQMGIRTCLMDPRLLPGGSYQDYYAYYREKGVVQVIEPTQQAILNGIQRYVARHRQGEDFDRYDAHYERLLDFMTQSGAEGVSALKLESDNCKQA